MIFVVGIVIIYIYFLGLNLSFLEKILFNGLKSFAVAGESGFR